MSEKEVSYQRARTDDDDTELVAPPSARAVIEALGCVAVLLDRDRRVVVANVEAERLSSKRKVHRLTGGYLGDVLGCYRQATMEGDCGERDVCQYCGGNRILRQAISNMERSSGRCRVLRDVDEGATLDADMTVTPLIFDERPYFLVSLHNISNDTQKGMLERLFFHDILNAASTMNGLVHLLKDADQTQLSELVELLGQVNSKMITTIQRQRQLVAAEAGSLVVSLSFVHVPSIVNEVVKAMSADSVAAKRTITVTECADKNIQTDELLLQRVLSNMLKNAVEATEVGGEVRIGATYESEEQEICFWVENPAVMKEEVRYQVFHRSFSTKGANRGFGTHSIRLFGEKYLRGRVSFVSEPGIGTRFTVCLPLEWAHSDSDQ